MKKNSYISDISTLLQYFIYYGTTVRMNYISFFLEN